MLVEVLTFGLGLALGMALGLSVSLAIVRYVLGKEDTHAVD